MTKEMLAYKREDRPVFLSMAQLMEDLGLTYYYYYYILLNNLFAQK